MSVIKITASSISRCMSTQLRNFLLGCGVEITRALRLGVAGDKAGGLHRPPQHRGLINSQLFTEGDDSQLGDPLGATYALPQPLGGRGGGAGCAHLPWAATSACSCHASGGPCCPSAAALLVSNPPPCRLLVGLAPSRSLAWCARALLIYAGGVSTSGSGRGDSHPSPSLIALAITTLGLRRGLSPTKEVRGSRRSALWRT